MPITSYTRKNGEILWKVNAYIGTNNLTGEKQIITKRGFKSKGEAQLFLAKQKVLFNEEQYEQYKFNKKVDYKFSELTKLWFAEYKATVTPSSLSRTKIIFKKHILPVMGDIKLSKLTPIVGKKKLDQMNLAFARKKLALSYIKRVLDYAINLGALRTNPMASVKLVQSKDATKEKKLKYYTKDELKLYLDTIKNYPTSYLQQRDYTLFRLLAFTGCRVGEISALTWADFNGNSLSITKTAAQGDHHYIADAPKTSASRRIVRLDDETIQILEKWRLTQSMHFFRQKIKPRYIFATPKNNFLKNQGIRDRYEFYRKLTDLPDITLHGFRHTHASLLFEAGASAKEVQARLGHSNISTTLNIYTHVTKEQQEKTTQKLTDYLDF